MSDYIPALPVNGKFSVIKRPDDDKYNPGAPALCWTLPVESIPAFIELLMAMEANTEKHKEVRIYNVQTKQNNSVSCIQLWHNGKQSQFGEDDVYGLIAPAKVTAISTGSRTEDFPF
jgi:hypothetical protein